MFRERILPYIGPETRALDLGAGIGRIPEMNFRGVAARVVGIDPDPRVVENPFLDEAQIGFGDSLPFESDGFDVVFSDNVAEHLEEPGVVFREVHRVLRPGGRFLFKTPNRWHYMPLIASATPTAFHQWFNRLRGRPEADTFPTRYRANSRKAVEKLARSTGFEIEAIERIEGRPEYMRISGLTYLFGAAYERTVNATPWLEAFRILLIATLRKPSA